MRARVAWLAALLGVPSLASVAARADDEVCARAYVETQRLQRAALFRAARQQAVTCGQEACSATVRSQCSEWLESIERALPTLVIDARDGSGAALASVSVEANGELLAERLNGRALELDPGEYVLRFRYGEQTVEQRTLIRESEKYRTLAVRFDPAPAVAVPVEVVPVEAVPAVAVPVGAVPSESVREVVLGPEVAKPVPTASYVLGGVGLVSLATFGVLAGSGYASEQQLRKSCAGACESDQVDSVRTRYLAADVALGVGVASLLGALAVWRWTPSETHPGGVLSLSPRRVALQGEF